MKLLILGRTLANFHGTSSLHLYRAIAKVTDCVFYGLEFEIEKDIINVGGNEHDALSIFEKEKPDVVWIQWYWSNKPSGDWQNLEKLRGKVPIVCNAGDPWSRLDEKAAFNKKYADLVLLDSGLPNEPIWEHKWDNFPAVLFHAAVNTEVYRPLGLNREFDTGVFGARGKEYYPFRNHINEELSQRTDIKSFHEPFLSGSLATTDGFVEAVNRCKTMVCTGLTPPYNVFTHKYVEGMACKTMVLGEMPLDSKQLNFIDGFNIISINKTNFIDRIMYYRNHDEERARIVEQAYETVLKYHTIEMRAQQFVGLCKLMVENDDLMEMVKELDYTYESIDID